MEAPPLGAVDLAAALRELRQQLQRHGSHGDDCQTVCRCGLETSLLCPWLPPSFDLQLPYPEYWIDPADGRYDGVRRILTLSRSHERDFYLTDDRHHPLAEAIGQEFALPLTCSAEPQIRAGKLHGLTATAVLGCRIRTIVLRIYGTGYSAPIARALPA